MVPEAAVKSARSSIIRSASHAYNKGLLNTRRNIPASALCSGGRRLDVWGDAIGHFPRKLGLNMAVYTIAFFDGWQVRDRRIVAILT